jgi:hypothetical protein
MMLLSCTLNAFGEGNMDFLRSYNISACDLVGKFKAVTNQQHALVKLPLLLRQYSTLGLSKDKETYTATKTNKTVFALLSFSFSKFCLAFTIP